MSADEHRARYLRAACCMQAGVKMDLNRMTASAPSANDIQARIGINTAMRDHGSIVGLLVSKGLVTEEEYCKAIADGMEAEVREYQDRLTRELGNGKTKITLVGRYGGIDDDKATS